MLWHIPTQAIPVVHHHPPPYLYSPPSPDYDGTITLTWRSSDIATGYRIYRSTHYDWGYVLIATPYLLSYTDQVSTPGYWYYMVKAYNSYGISLASNKICVEYSDEIIILSPAQTNFTKMEGYYPATYGFENEDDGTSGTDIDFIDAVDYLTTTIEASKGTHKKVLHCSNSISWQWARHYFSPLVWDGTIEFWILFGETNERHVLYIVDSAAQGITLNWHEDGNFYPKSGVNKGSYNANQWYHVRIEFDCDTDWHIWLDGVSLDGGSGYSFDSDPSPGIYQFTFGGSSGQDLWLDAIGFSWDSNYKIGDNLNEGILLDFEPNDLDYMVYQLDTNPLIEIYGDTVIPLPDYGLHTIKVEGEKNSEFYESDIREFTISPIEIISPMEKGYRRISTAYPGTFSFEEDNEGDDPGQSLYGFYQASLGFDEDANGDKPDGAFRGTYKASIGFEDEETGTRPTSFDVLEGDNCYVEIVEKVPEHLDWDYHTKVVQLYDSNGGDAQITQYFYEEQSNGAIEFWFYHTIYGWDDAKSHFRFIDTYENSKIDLFVQNEQLSYYTLGEQFITITNYPIIDKCWYHFKITFECGAGWYDDLAADHYNVYVMQEGGTEETRVIESASFKNGGTSSLDTLRFSTSENNWEFISCYDAIGYSWDENYEVGDNLQNIARWKLVEYYPLDCGAQVIASYEDHTKVLKIWDNVDTNVNLIHPFFNGSKASGTIEYWQLITEIIEVSNQRIVCIKAEDGITNLIRLRILLGKLEYYHPTQGWISIISSLKSNIWDHYRIDFETTTGNYMGLPPWRWRLLHNGIEYGPFIFESTSFQPAQLHFDTSGKHNNLISYFDAIGFSWDPSYEIGNNLDELYWAIQETAKGTIQVINVMDEHSKVAEFHHLSDSTSNDKPRMIDAILRDSGIIEYWIKVTDNQEPTYMRIQQVDYHNSVDFWIEEGKFKYFYGTIHDITNCKIDHWYHIRIQFDCGINGGDGSKDWHLWIDGVSQDNGIGYEFQGSPEKMNLIVFESYKTTSDQEKYVYIDAIGYSWDTSYNIGDNTQPCIILSFTGQDELNQMWYSLDGGEKKEIDGDTFFEKPELLGEHTIQVFGELYNGDWCQSDIRYFNIYFAPTLLCIHGYGNSGNIWVNHLMEREYFIENYGLENIIPLSYYEKDNEPPEFDGVDFNTKIQEVAERLKNYIINEYYKGSILDYLDIVCFSMGGLVARYMIKRFYPELKAEGITIEHVATLGTPHYGSYWANLKWWRDNQEAQMAIGSDFLADLNYYDDTPFSISDNGPYNDIKYSIFRGATLETLFLSDNMVSLDCARLYSNDVTIYGNCVFWGHRCYQTDHDGLFKSSRVLRDVFKEFWYN